MLHIVGFRDGKAFYRNRFVRTDGFAAENEAGGPLWPGLAEPLSLAKRDYGWGARTLMKDASSTDVIVHRGTALTSFYQCGDLYRVDPFTGDTLGKEDWNGGVPVRLGRLGAPQGRRRAPASCCSSTTASRRPTCTTAWSTRNNELVHYIDVPLPGPRLPHDMAFTENYAILNDFPLFWDPELLERDAARRPLPPRHAVPVRGACPAAARPAQIRWFEADPTYVLHFTNAYEDGDEIVLDGFYQGDPEPDRQRHRQPSGSGPSGSSPSTGCRPGCTAGGSTWSPAAVTEEQLSDTITEFGMINPGYAGGPYRYTYAATGKPGWFLFDGLVHHDLQTGTEERYRVRRRRVRQRDGDGAPGRAARAEDDGYLVTITTDMNADASYCLVFDAARLEDGPVCKLQLCRNGFRAAPIRPGRPVTRCAAGTPQSRPQRRSDCRCPTSSTPTSPPSWRPTAPTPSAGCSGCSATSGPC